MNFEFNDLQEQLRASVRRYLADRAPITPYVREGYGTARGADPVWQGLAELGTVGLLADEKHGGSGDGSGDGSEEGQRVGMVDAAVVLEECGRAVYPGPYLSSAIGAVSLVALAGSERELSDLLPGLVDGGTIGTLALFETGLRTDWRSPRTLGAADAESIRITGTKRHVLDAANAALFLVSAVDPSGAFGVYAVHAGAQVLVESDDSLDGSRDLGTVHFDGAEACRLSGPDPERAVQRTLDRLRTALVIDAVGTADRALQLTVEYAKERIAFGKPIGSFQAVQHLCADMLRALELSRAAGYYACWALDHADATHAHLAAVQAAAYASEELPKLGGQAIQVFGGIGFTWEHDIHLFYKRLVSAGAVLGNADDRLAELADLVLDREN